jgi:hypothetical protein
VVFTGCTNRAAVTGSRIRTVLRPLMCVPSLGLSSTPYCGFPNPAVVVHEMIEQSTHARCKCGRWLESAQVRVPSMKRIPWSTWPVGFTGLSPHFFSLLSSIIPC